MSQSPPFPSQPIDSDDPESEVSADDSGGAPPDTPGDKKGGKGTFVAALVSALASLLTAVIALTAVTYASPAEVRAEVKSRRRHVSVKIERPADGEEINKKLSITGTVRMPSDWVLLVFVQTPEELKYYVAGGGAITVKPDGHWEIQPQTLGSEDPAERPGDLNKSYKIYAVVATREGQRQFLDLLAKVPEKEKDAPWLPVLPHHPREDIHTVALVA
jgi:hypothetical protein